MTTKEELKNIPGATSDIIGNGLQGVDNYLSMIHCSLEMLLLSDLPDYVMSDLIKVYQAEQEASQIVRSLRIHCHQNT